MKIFSRLTEKLLKLGTHPSRPVNKPPQPQSNTSLVNDSIEHRTASSPTTPPSVSFCLTTPSSTNSPCQSDSIFPMPQKYVEVILREDTFLASEEIKNNVLESLDRNVADPKSVALLSRLLSTRPNDIALLTLRAVLYRLNNEMKECIDDCNVILRADPSNRFALLHRLSAASTDVFNPHKKSRDYAIYLIQAQDHALASRHDKLSLAVLTIWIEDVPGASEIVKELRKRYLENPEDIFYGTVLMSAILSRRMFKVSIEEKREIGANANLLL